MDSYEETFQTWNKIAQAYQDHFMELPIYNESYNTFCDLLPHDNASVFEIGCGPGNITRYLLQQLPELTITGIDIAPNMIALAQQNNPTADFMVMDGRAIGTLNKQFDAILCGFCIPYFSENDNTQLISDCANLLHNEGLFYVSFVAGNPKDSGFIQGSTGDRTYFYFHELKTIKQQLEATSFIIIEEFHIPYTKADGSEEFHTIIIAKKVNTSLS